MLSRLLASARYRAKWARLGVFYLRSPDWRSLRIAGNKVSLSIPPGQDALFGHEFHEIVLNDCYRLARVEQPVRTVLDVGANIGLFAIAARHHFPRATIHGYEPNPALRQMLLGHCRQLDATPYFDAVGSEDGMVTLSPTPNVLVSTTEKTLDGDTHQTSFAAAVARLGAVDLLKLDCEGAEWDIFTDTATWSAVRSVVMEYHLWAKLGSTVADVKAALSGLGFDAVSIHPNPSGPWGFAFARRNHAA